MEDRKGGLAPPALQVPFNMERYERLKVELPVIAGIVSEFPETLHQRAFDALVSALLGHEQSPAAPVPPPTSTNPSLNAVPGPSSTGPRGASDTISGVALRTKEGEVKLLFKDPKASSSGDAARRIAYVAIRANELLTGDERVSFRRTVTPALQRWRLKSGGIRTAIRVDPGILRADDLAWLDEHAKDEADQFIRDIQNREAVGTWNPGEIRRVKRTRADGVEEEVEEAEGGDTGEGEGGNGGSGPA